MKNKSLALLSGLLVTLLISSNSYAIVYCQGGNGYNAYSESCEPCQDSSIVNCSICPINMYKGSSAASCDFCPTGTSSKIGSLSINDCNTDTPVTPTPIIPTPVIPTPIPTPTPNTVPETTTSATTNETSTPVSVGPVYTPIPLGGGGVSPNNIKKQTITKTIKVIKKKKISIKNSH